MVLEVHKSLVSKIDAFLASSRMSVSYFGKRATGNSEVVTRLKAGRSITGLTEQKILVFIEARSVDAAGVSDDHSASSCSAVPAEGSA